MSTCNRLDLQTLGSQPVMHKNLPDHCFKLTEIFKAPFFKVKLTEHASNDTRINAEWHWQNLLEIIMRRDDIHPARNLSLR